MNYLLLVVFISQTITVLDAYKHGSNPRVSRFSKRKCVPKTVSATCTMISDPGAKFKVTGTVEFTQTIFQYCKSYGKLRVKASLKGFPRGASKRGFHVHQFGNLTGGCASAGPHYNPFNRNHGAPFDRQRHVGDFGNVRVRTDGTVDFSHRDRVANLFGRYSIIGRAVVLHAGRDDLGRGGNPESKVTGNAGARLACCVIGRSN